MTPNDSISTLSDSLAADTLSTDTLPAGEQLHPIVISEPQPSHSPAMRPGYSSGYSWLMLGVVAVFCLVCARFKSNAKYFKALLHDLTSVRERDNAFDDTVKETSYIILLNLLCAVSCGLLMWVLMPLTGIPGTDDGTPSAAWTCIAMCAAYSLLMPPIYYIVGNVFSDALHTRMWVRGFLASQALLGILLIIPAMICLFHPTALTVMAVIAIAIFAIVKIIFIYKGFRIFFTQISSWMLFLYYLCTLEIIPLLITCTCAMHLA